MLRPFRLALLLVPLFLGLAPAAEESPADGPTTDAFLIGKGLYRVGNAYVLADQPARDAKARRLTAAIEGLELEYKPLLDELSRLDREIKSRSKAAQRNQARDERRAFELANQADLERYRIARDELTGARQSLIDETRRRYEGLWADPPVKRAIRAYNRDHRPKIVLGPVASPDEYRAVLLRDDAALLVEKGMILERGPRWVVRQELRVGVLAAQAQARLVQYRAAEASLAAGAPAKLAAKRAAAAARLTMAPESLRRPLAAEIALLDAQLRRLSPEDPGSPAAWRARADHLDRSRGAFLEAVAEARRAVDAAPAARRQLEADREVRDSLEELTGRAPRLAEAPEYRRGLALLEGLEAAIRVDRLPIRREADGSGLVAVTFNGSHAARAALDPSAATTRLPGSLAGALGVVPGPGAAVIDVLRTDSTTARGRLARLGSVAVGPASAEAVPCVVLPADAPGPGVPVLGADLLVQLGARADAEGAFLVLTRIVSAPHPAVGGP